MTTSLVSDVSGPIGHSEDAQATAIRDHEFEKAYRRTSVLEEVFADELIDLEAVLPEDWEISRGPGLVLNSDRSTRAATEAECRSFRVTLPDVTFDVGGDIRQQVREKLIDLAADCLHAATALRGSFEPLDDDDDDDGEEAAF